MLTDPFVFDVVDGRRVWRLPDGRMVPVISGGDTDAPPQDPTDDPPPDPAGDDPPDGDEPLGDAGRKALDAWKARAKKAEPLAKRAEQLEAELAELKRQQMSDAERALDEARREAAEAAKSEVLTTVQAKLFTSELRAAIATTLRPEAQKDLLVKPEVALALLGLDEFPVTPEGDIDGEAISQHVAAYVEARPHLAADATSGPGSIDQGARGTPPASKTLDEQIAEAEANKDWKLAGRLKTQKMLAAS